MVVILSSKQRALKSLKEPTLFGETIQLSTEVKYLGLTLDKGLTCSAQLDEVMNKAYTVLWTCRGLSVEGMRPETKSSALAAQHGGKTHNNLWYHGVVAKGKIQD
jgi:hypothetical protein